MVRTGERNATPVFGEIPIKLPVTGAEIAGIVSLALAFLGVGTVVLAGNRRRKRAA